MIYVNYDPEFSSVKKHKETKDKKRVNNSLRMTSLDQRLCSIVVGYAQYQKNATG
jgi:hypothetical protein